MQKLKRDYIVLIFIYLIIFSVFQYGIQKIYGFTLYPDEFGYWASAARAVGYDWSEAASMGSYYSYGYSLILIPVLKLFSGGVRAYRAALAVNMLLMCVSVFLLWKISLKILPRLEHIKREFACGVGVLYPAWIFYMQTTMSEALLNFLFILITYLFLSFIEKPRTINAIFLAVALIYIYCVHMRTVALVIASIVTCILWGFAEGGKRKQVFIFGIALTAAGFVSLLLKERTIFEVYTYADQKNLAVNDYASQWEKLADIWTLQGSIRLIESVIGKLFYLGVSSFGIFYWGVGWCVCKSAFLIKALRKKQRIARFANYPHAKQRATGFEVQPRDCEEISPKYWLAFFLLWSATGEILISSIYMCPSGNIDGLIYGRYTELLVPLMLLLGIAAMDESRFLIPATLLNGIICGGVLPFLLDVIEERNLKGLRGYHIAGLSYLINESNLNEVRFFTNTWVLGFGIMLLVSILIWLGRRWKNGWILAGILLIEILAGIQISHHYTYRVNNILYENQMIAEVIRENFVQSDQIFYLDEGNGAFVDFLQMQLPDETIHILDAQSDGVERDELLRSGRFLIADAETPNDQHLQKFFDKKITTNMFCLYFDPEG